MTIEVEHEDFIAISEPMRLSHLPLLTKRESSVCSSGAVLNQPPSTIFKHMAQLKAAGIKIDRKAGR